MDMYTEGNGGFQALEGTSPFEESSQLQTDGYTEAPYQGPAAEPAWYGEAQGAEGLPTGAYQETVMQAGGYDNIGGAEALPAGPYQENMVKTAGDGSTYGAGDFSAVPYQEPAAEAGAGLYMGEADALPVAPGHMLPQEIEDTGMYQEAVSPMGEGFLAQAEMPGMGPCIGCRTGGCMAADSGNGGCKSGGRFRNGRPGNRRYGNSGDRDNSRGGAGCRQGG